MAEHLEYKQLLSAYIDGELNQEDTRRIERHLLDCADCQKYYKEISKISTSLQSWNDESLSPDCEHKINQSFKQAQSREGQPMQKKYLIPTTALATLIIGLVAVTISRQVFKQTSYFDEAQQTVQARKQIVQTTQQPFQATDLDSNLPLPDSGVSGRQDAKEKGLLNFKQPAGSETLNTLGGIPAVKEEGKAGYAQAVQKPQSARARESLIADKLSKDAELSQANGSSAQTPALTRAPAEKRIVTGTVSNVDLYGYEVPVDDYRAAGETFSTEEYDRIYENEFMDVTQNPLSTFSIDVDTASYSNLRRYLNSNTMPPRDAVRIEEMINYFTYDYPYPKDNKPFSITTEAAVCPWNKDHQLALIGLQGKIYESAEIPPSNIVFLIDVSGSMNQPNKLPLLKSAFKMLVNQLREDERVAIVVYAGAAGKVLDSVRGTEKQKILSAIDNLQAGGSTAGGAGIQLAYKIAQDNFIKGGNNRVILATDGDFNIGVSSTGDLTRLIEQEREQGVFLTVLGFGTGNYKDTRMEQLANKGNGNYYYIDTDREAKKVLVSELGSTLFTIAKDVKLQIEFNPSQVKAYRLIGYENRVLAKEDFNDDTKDAGELGAGHSVTALYEIVPADAEFESRPVDELMYQQRRVVPSPDLMTVKLRYKDPDGTQSRLIQQTVTTDEVLQAPSQDFQFAAAVAEFGLLLRDSKYKERASYEHVLQAAKRSQGKDAYGYRQELIDLVEKAQRFDNRTSQGDGIFFKGKE